MNFKLTVNFLSRQAVVSEGGVSDGDLQRRDVEGCHVVLAASFILIIDYVFPHIIIGAGVLDLSFPPSVVYNENEHQNCKKFELIV